MFPMLAERKRQKEDVCEYSVCDRVGAIDKFNHFSYRTFLHVIEIFI